MSNKVYLNKEFEAPMTRVFEALTNPEAIIEWFGPKNTVTKNVFLDLKVGGNYQYEIERPDKSTFFIYGEFREIDYPNRLVYTNKYENLPSAADLDSVVTIELVETTAGTRLEFQQEFRLTPKDLTTRVESWEQMFARLSDLLHS